MSRSFLAGICLLAGALSAEPSIPAELQIVAAQPAVFLVAVCGDYQLTCPKQVMVDDEKLRKDVADARAAGSVPAGQTDAQHAWTILAGTPGAYLEASKETLARAMVDRPYTTGTAFAVSREGILLTNAHLFLDPDPAGVPQTPAVLEMFVQTFQPILLGLAERLGGPPSEAEAEVIAAKLLDWWGSHCRASGKFGRARLVLKFDRPDRRLALGSAGSFFAEPKAIWAPLEILAIGEPAPGKDVAVLRADLNLSGREQLKAAGARDDEIDSMLEAGSRDKLICLPLGDSSDVLVGTRVQALGFPGNAYLQEWMTEAAGYRVSAREGQIGATKPVRGGYEMFEMSAGITHGDSGGPVIDAQGRVIGINVGGGDSNATTLAVPIHVAKEFLAKAGIKADPGRLTQRWVEGLAAYHAGKFAPAHDLFDLVVRCQGSDMVLMAQPDPLAPPRAQAFGIRAEPLLLAGDLVNPYVRDMKRRTAAKLAAR